MIEEIKKFEGTSVFKILMSDSNIYLSIYSVDSYIFNKELLSKKDKISLEKLKDKFDEKEISKLIKKVRKCLSDLISKSDTFIQAKIFFNPKKVENGKVEFRPLHTTDLVSQIALVSMLNMFIYELNVDGKPLTLSNISRLIPSNFYGNRVSTKPEELFKPWKKQYKKYIQKANELFENYHNTHEYKYEVDLDLKNFFPSINPKMLYNYILSLLPVTINDAELELYKIMLIKLLICKIDKIDNLSDNTIDLYYGKSIQSDEFYSKGIPQGLPQSYFLGNICMIEVAKIFDHVFKGISLFYVDDSVIFTNDITGEKEFCEKLNIINKEIGALCKKFIEENDDDFFRIYNNEMTSFLRKNEFNIKVHDTSGKSTFSDISAAKDGEIYLKSLSREVSQIGFDLFTTYSEEEDNNINRKMEILVEAIRQEQEILSERYKSMEVEELIEKEKIENYKVKLSRFLKFFRYRKLKSDIEKNDENIKFEEIKIPLEDKEFIEKFLELYKQDIWCAYLSLCIKSNMDKKYLNEIRDYIVRVNNKIFGFDNKKSSYIYTSFKWFIQKEDELQECTDKYFTINKIVRNKYKKYSKLHMHIIYDFIGDTIKKYKWDDLLVKTELFSKKFLKMISYVDSSSCEIKRMVLNAIYSQLFSVQINDNFVLARKSKRNLNYGQVRLLVFLRSKWFTEKEFKEFNLDLFEESNRLKIDNTILEVLDAFGIFVKHPLLVDNLLLVHQYTCDVWKNGSKYLYFYTLHNQEHAVDLIKNILKIIKAIDYLQISSYDYYILFIACYLHDISMVKIPSMDSFLTNSDTVDKIGMEYLKMLKDQKGNDILTIKNLLITFYKKVDDFFENEIRSKHAVDSAYEIRSRDDLNFLDVCLREIVAEVAIAHGQRVEDVYNVKSEAKDKIISLKFDKILLRIADLLDMSSYRVSKKILNHNIEQMSSISSFHWISHLLTKGYELKTEYNIRDSSKSALMPRQIEEKIILHIYVDMSQLSQIKNNEKCKFGALDLSSVSLEGFKINCGEKCDSARCNFLCKWFVKKNEYLLTEFAALKEYLNRASNNFYKTNIVIQLHVTEKTKLDAQQFEILKGNLV